MLCIFLMLYSATIPLSSPLLSSPLSLSLSLSISLTLSFCLSITLTCLQEFKHRIMVISVSPVSLHSQWDLTQKHMYIRIRLMGDSVLIVVNMNSNQALF